MPSLVSSHPHSSLNRQQSQEKIDLLRMLGAEVYPVPAVPFENPQNYNHQARAYAAQLDNAIWTDQFDNTANTHAHYLTTGPEIWAQTEGAVDGFVCSTGTGGTLAGVGKHLKEKSGGKTQVWLADPPGSVLHAYVSSGGKLIERKGSSITEGPRIPIASCRDHAEGCDLIPQASGRDVSRTTWGPLSIIWTDRSPLRTKSR